MDPKDIASQADYWMYCTIHSKSIFVREEVDGKWSSVSLENLPPARRAHHINRMMVAGIVPTRIKTEEEQPHGKE